MPVIVAVAFLVLSLFMGHPREKSTHPLELRVNQIMSMSAPAYIRLTTRVEPDIDNRQICIFVANSEGTYEASSCRDTDGAPITIEWNWWMPAGHYQAAAVLNTSEKSIQTRVKFEIVGSGE